MPLWLTTPMTRPESFSSSCTGRPSGRLPDASTRSTTRSTAGTSLERAWEEVRRNRGAPGVDGVTIAQVERQGVEGFLDELAVQLQDGTYRPLPVRRVTIPKPQGGERNDSPWLLWRLHRLEGRMESWHTTRVPTRPRSATRPSCVSGRCAWCWRPWSRPASASG